MTILRIDEDVFVNIDNVASMNIEKTEDNKYYIVFQLSNGNYLTSKSYENRNKAEIAILNSATNSLYLDISKY